MAKTDDPGRRNPLTYMMVEVLDEWVRQLMFTLPGRIVSFDPSTQLAQVEAGIQRVVEGRGQTIPVIEQVPVCFPGDGAYYFWHQITPGETEGLLHFSQRAIDTWIDQGGPIPPHELRVLSEEDCFFEPGYRSRPSAIPGFKNDGAGISNYAGDQYLHLLANGTAELFTPSDATVDVGGNLDATIGGNETTDVTGNQTATVGGTATIEASSAAVVTAPAITLNGPVQINGALTVTGDGTINGLSFSDHTHSQGTDSAGDSEVETDPPTGI